MIKPSELEEKLEVQFCNSKSIELFGVDLASDIGGKNDLYKAQR